MRVCADALAAETAAELFRCIPSGELPAMRAEFASMFARLEVAGLHGCVCASCAFGRHMLVPDVRELSVHRCPSIPKQSNCSRCNLLAGRPALNHFTTEVASMELEIAFLSLRPKQKPVARSMH
jgi:hypothetical protein